MKKIKYLVWFVPVLAMLLFACGGGGGSSSGGSGILSMSITDARPMLPSNVTNLFVTFDEVFVHKSGGSWISLPLAQSPYTIDLLQFQDGNTTEFVPPTVLSSGEYTQVRVGVIRATLRFNNGVIIEDKTVVIPSANLKTDKNFTLDMAEGSAATIIIHFDLSQSLVVTGPQANPSYKLKPVLHLFEDPQKAAIITGSIDNASFGASDKVTIIVTAESNLEEYTRVEVSKSGIVNPTEFDIFWIVPDESYTVEIDLDQDGVLYCEEIVDAIDLSEGTTFELNSGVFIETGAGICP
jgi:uncharacterized protein DUF4382